VLVNLTVPPSVSSAVNPAPAELCTGAPTAV